MPDQRRLPHFLAALGVVLIAAVLMLVATFAAYAQVATPGVHVPWGDWVVDGIDAVLPAALLALSSVATYVVGAYVPPWLKAIAGNRVQQQVNEVLEKAVLSAVAQVKGAVVGKKVSVPIANQVLRTAGQYAVDRAPDLMKQATGGSVDALKEMLLARMEQAGITPAYFGKPPPKSTKSAATDFNSAVRKGLGG